MTDITLAQSRIAARIGSLGTRVSELAERVLADWADHVGADRLRQVYDTLLDLREITDPWQ